MTSAFDDGAPDWAPEFDTTTALDDPAMEQDDLQSDGSLAWADEQADGDSSADSLEGEANEGRTDAGTGDPVDYWDSEQTPGDAAPQPHFGESVTARDDDLGHDVDVRFSSPGSSWGTDSEGRDVWRDANGSLHKYE